VKRHTTASCFATYMLPHVLFVADFEERERIARVCCLAWNIGLFPQGSRTKDAVYVACYESSRLRM